MAGAKALAEATVRARKAAENFMVGVLWFADDMTDCGGTAGDMPTASAETATAPRTTGIPLFFYTSGEPPN